MPSNSNAVCVPCRLVLRVQFGAQDCPRCGDIMENRGSRWRAPKKNNDKAWALIESGDWLWDKKAIADRALKKRKANERWYAWLKKKQRENSNNGKTKNVNRI